MYIRRKSFSTTEIDGMKEKEFARADYAGLTPENAAKLRAQRAELAKNLKNRRLNNELVFIWSNVFRSG